MYGCPNCGGDLQFDIRLQKLGCKYCGGVYEIEEVKKEEDAKEIPKDEYQVTRFTCNACGATIESTNLTAAAFCSYCGGAAILSGRLQNEKRPARILPFQVTKEDCKAKFTGLTKRMPYVPKEYKDPEFLDRFMGFYLPYWTYKAEMKGKIEVAGTDEYTRGDYQYTDTYSFKGDIDTAYDGISFDASGSFDDDISLRIAPFDKQKMVPFEPGYMLGFYADTADVPAKLYEEDAKNVISADIDQRLLEAVQENGGSSFSFEDGEIGLTSKKVTRQMKAERTMLPVWFLTYRNKDRMAYSVVNGESGKVYADVPIRMGMFFASSAVLAAIIFFILNAFVSLTGFGLLKTSSILAFLTAVIYYFEIDRIEKKEYRTFDKGYQMAFYGKEPDELGKSLKIRKSPRTFKRPSLKNVLVILIVIACFFEWLLIGAAIMVVAMMLIDIIGAIILFIMVWRKRKRNKNIKITEAIISLSTVLFANVILFCDPAQDIYYYGGTILAFLGIALALSGIIRKYNVFATKPIPDFFVREGGDDRG